MTRIYSTQSNILCHAPARGRNQGEPVYNPNGALGNSKRAKGCSLMLPDTIASADMRHLVEGKIQGAAPNIIHFCILQLWIDLDHFPSQYFRAAFDRTGSFREKCSPSAEDHAVVPQSEII